MGIKKMASGVNRPAMTSHTGKGIGVTGKKAVKTMAGSEMLRRGGR